MDQLAGVIGTDPIDDLAARAVHPGQPVHHDGTAPGAPSSWEPPRCSRSGPGRACGSCAARESCARVEPGSDAGSAVAGSTGPRGPPRLRPTSAATTCPLSSWPRPFRPPHGAPGRPEAICSTKDQSIADSQPGVSVHLSLLGFALVFDNHTIPRRHISLVDPGPRHQRAWTTQLAVARWGEPSSGPSRCLGQWVACPWWSRTLAPYCPVSTVNGLLS
jgi:hypothetical protein